MLLLRHLFLQYSDHLVKEIAKLLKTSERWVNRWSKVKTLEDKPWELQGVHVDGRFCTNCVRNVIKKSCKYVRNNSKKLQLNNVKVSSTTVGRYVTNKGWKALKRKKDGAHFIQASWHQKNLQTLYQKYQRTTGRLTQVIWTLRDHLDYRWWDNIQRFSPQNTGRARTVITLRLEKCEYRHALGARTFYTSPLRKCKKT